VLVILVQCADVYVYMKRVSGIVYTDCGKKRGFRGTIGGGLNGEARKERDREREREMSGERKKERATPGCRVERHGERERG